MKKAITGCRRIPAGLRLGMKQLGMEKTPYRVAMAFSHFFSVLQENPEDYGVTITHLIGRTGCRTEYPLLFHV